MTAHSRDNQALVTWFDGCDEVVVAFSGGVDSSVVLAAALRSSAGNVTAVTARSPSVPAWQIELAETVARQLGADHQIMETAEVELPAYRVNDPSRCFHCKSTLYASLHQLSRAAGFATATIVSGTNADDLGDYRPGINAGDDAGIRKPLAELGLGKPAVRSLAKAFGLSNADLPASPCLASRIAYGVEVTPQRLAQVERAENYLRALGFAGFRVRLHDGELARIEVPAERISELTDEAVRQKLVQHFVELGFRYVTIDLQGFSSGSMNRQILSIGALASNAPLGTATIAADPNGIHLGETS